MTTATQDPSAEKLREELKRLEADLQEAQETAEALDRKAVEAMASGDRERATSLQSERRTALDSVAMLEQAREFLTDRIREAEAEARRQEAREAVNDLVEKAAEVAREHEDRWERALELRAELEKLAGQVLNAHHEQARLMAIARAVAERNGLSSPSLPEDDRVPGPKPERRKRERLVSLDLRGLIQTNPPSRFSRADPRKWGDAEAKELRYLLKEREDG